METKRVVVPEMEEILGQEFKVLDHGFIRVVDYMGSDSSIVQSARVSYGAGTKTVNQDAGLINYLIRHRHTSPLESCEMQFHIKMPIFIARQWARHRTASCLTGDTKISFDSPTGNNGKPWKHYALTVKQLFSRFQPTSSKRLDKQRNSFHKRDQIQKMKLRYYDLQNNTISHTKILDIWSNGVKDVYKIILTDGTSLRCTSDHRLFTNEGWVDAQTAYSKKLLIGVQKRKEKATPRQMQHTDEDLKNEIWKPILLYGDRYDVSSFGRVRSWYNQCNRRFAKPKQKLVTMRNGYNIVSLSKDGVSKVYKVSRLLLEAFLPLPAYEGLCARHINSNSLDDKLENLAWGTYLENAQDRFITGCNQELSLVFVKINQFEHTGKEEVFDIKVEAESHNFFANNICVHNCNEISARYSVIKDEFYVPEIDQVCEQSKGNKQGRDRPLNENIATEIQEKIREHGESSFAIYNDFLSNDMARELARGVLPQSTYTEMYWKIDLHNLLHFLSLRADIHAQEEIRVYALQMLEIVKKWVPLVYNAFVNYRQKAITFSGLELEKIAKILDNDKLQALIEESEQAKGEIKELAEKLKKLVDN